MLDLESDLDRPDKLLPSEADFGPEEPPRVELSKGASATSTSHTLEPTYAGDIGFGEDTAAAHDESGVHHAASIELTDEDVVRASATAARNIVGGLEQAPDEGRPAATIPPGPPEDLPEDVDEFDEADLGDLGLEDADDDEALEQDGEGEGEGGDRSGVETADAEWESGLRVRFADFAPAREQLEDELDKLPSAREHPDFVGEGGDEEAPGYRVYRIASQEAPEDKAFVTRVAPEAYQGDDEEAVEERYQSLVRGHNLPVEIRPYTEQIVAFDPVKGSVTGYEGKSVRDMNEEEWHTVSGDQGVLDTQLQVLSNMFTTGLNPDVQGDPLANTTWNEEKQRFVVIDYALTEDDDYDTWDPDDPRVAVNSAVGDFETFAEALAMACPNNEGAIRIREQSQQLAAAYRQAHGIHIP